MKDDTGKKAANFFTACAGVGYSLGNLLDQASKAITAFNEWMDEVEERHEERMKELYGDDYDPNNH